MRRSEASRCLSIFQASIFQASIFQVSTSQAPTFRPSIVRTSIVAAGMLLGGCATLEDFRKVLQGADRSVPVDLAERPLAEPISRNHFMLEAPGQSVVGEPQIVFARGTDTFSDLAREYGLGYDELVDANPGIDPWLPGEGTAVLLPTQYVLPDVPKRGVVLNIASKRLFYFPAVADGQPQEVLTFPIGIGRVGWETPLGVTTVVSRATDPHWYVPASIRKEHAEMGDPLPAVVPPGPDNPLGTHVLKLEMPGYLIHGTNQPYGVGMRVSHGCVRLYPENIELLYELVDIGEPVRIVNEPFLLGSLGGELYFESHAPLEDDAVTVEERIDALIEHWRSPEGPGMNRLATEHVRALASTTHGVPVRVSQYDLQEMYARARAVRNTVEADPNAPTLSEVRDMIDEAVREAGQDEEEPL